MPVTRAQLHQFTSTANQTQRSPAAESVADPAKARGVARQATSLKATTHNRNVMSGMTYGLGGLSVASAIVAATVASGPGVFIFLAAAVFLLMFALFANDFKNQDAEKQRETLAKSFGGTMLSAPPAAHARALQGISPPYNSSTNIG